MKKRSSKKADAAYANAMKYIDQLKSALITPERVKEIVDLLHTKERTDSSLWACINLALLNKKHEEIVAQLCEWAHIGSRQTFLDEFGQDVYDLVTVA